MTCPDLLWQIRNAWDLMVSADNTAERLRREVDRLCAAALDDPDGPTARAIGQVVQVDHANIVRRAERHRRAEANRKG